VSHCVRRGPHGDARRMREREAQSRALEDIGRTDVRPSTCRTLPPALQSAGLPLRKVQRRKLRRCIPMPLHPAFPRRRRTVPHSFHTQLLLTFSASRLGSAPPAKILVTTLVIGICGTLGMRRRSLCCSLLLAGVGMLGRESCSRREGKKKLNAPFSFMPPCPAWVCNQRLLAACVNVEGGM
jgi:hypothetical protein